MTRMGSAVGRAVVVGAAWMLAWSAAGGVSARVFGIDSDLPLPFLFAPFGFATGIVFFAILEALGWRRSLDRVQVALMAALGAVSGLAFAVFVASLRGDALGRELLVFGPLLALAGAVSAAGSLAAARRRQPATPF